MARHELSNEPANGALQWNVLLAAALCPPPPLGSPHAKKELQGERTQSDCGGGVLEPYRIQDPWGTPFFGASKNPK